MTLALNMMASWLTALIVVGWMLLGSTAAHAHVAHCEEASERLASLQATATEAVAFHGPMLAAEPAVQTADTAASAPGKRHQDSHPCAEGSCCGAGVSGCSLGALMQVVSSPPVFVRDTAVASFDAKAMTGIILEGLIRPPKAFV